MNHHRRRRLLAPVATALAVVCALALALVAAPLVATADDGGNVAMIGDTEYATLAEAVSAAEDGDTITLIADASASSTIQVSGKDITLDLNGCALTFESSSSFYQCALYLYDAGVTIKNGTIVDECCEEVASTKWHATIYVAYGDLALDGVTVQAYAPYDASSCYYSYVVYVYNGNETVTIADCTIEELTDDVESRGQLVGVVVYGYYSTDGYDASYLTDSTKYVATLSVSSSTITTSGFCISGQGGWHNTSFTVSDSELTSTGSLGIYHPQYGTLVVTGSTITGARSGIEVRSGIASISNSTVTSTAATATASPNANGPTTYGVGIAVSQHTSNLPISVTIEDCAVSGACAVLVVDVQDSVTDVSVSIEGGTYASTGTLTVTYSDGSTATSTSAVYADDDLLTIHCGYFTSEVDAGYVADTATAIGAEGSYVTVVHTLEQVDAVAATCTEDGNVAYYCCAHCGDCFTATTTTSTDDDGNVTTTTIYAAADYDTDIVLAATGHDWDGGTVTTEATCTEDGVVTYVCQNDPSHTYTEALAATGHTEGDPVTENVVEATCDEDGSYDVVVYCDVCGAELSRETVAVEATGHTWSDTGTVTWSEDHSSATITVTCETCGEELTVDATVTSVTNDDGSVTYTATADIDGTTHVGTLTVAAETDESEAEAETATEESETSAEESEEEAATDESEEEAEISESDSDDASTSVPATGDDAPAGVVLALAAGVVAVGCALLRRRLAA